MNSSPAVSVIMSVYTEADTLEDTLTSVLSQEGVDLEFIFVNDGSTDESLSMLEDRATADNRVRIIDQENQGLTHALITGCAAARGDYIARQDAGDISLPGRFTRQLEILEQYSDVVMVSCGTHYIGPKGELLYAVQQSTQDADSSLRVADPSKLHGPSHHGCTMFRRDAYEKSGGYRSEFKVAQDLDLWTRLVEFGRHEVVQEVLYEASLAPGAISSNKRELQLKTTNIIVECMKARVATGDDGAEIEKLAEFIETGKPVNRKKADAEFYYFIASLLKHSDPRGAQQYLRMALKLNPIHLKAWVRTVQARFGIQ